MEILESIKKVFTLEFMQGFRTYLMGLLMILQALAGIFSGDLDGLEVLMSSDLFEGLFGAGLMSLRAGMEKKESK